MVRPHLPRHIGLILLGLVALLADVAARSGELTSVGSAELAGGRVFHEIRAAGEQDTKLMVRDVDGRTRVLFDPRTLPGDGEQVLDRWMAAPDGRHVLLQTSLRGTEHSTIRVADVDAGTLLDVAIPHAQGLSWTGDSRGFSYLKFIGAPGTPGYFVGNEPRLHRLGGGATDAVLAQRGRAGIVATPEQFLLVVFEAGSDTALAIVRDGRSEAAVYRAEAAAALAGERARQLEIGPGGRVDRHGAAGRLARRRRQRHAGHRPPARTDHRRRPCGPATGALPG